MVENYNSMDLAAFKNVWVFCEQRQGKMMPTTFELISEGRTLADELGVNLCGLLLGDNVEGIAKELGGYGADEVIVCEHPLLKNYTTDAYAKVICDVISEMKPEAFLIGATNIVTIRSRGLSSERVPMTAGTVQPKPSSNIINDLPCKPTACIMRSKINAARAM